ncbi:MAG TPA: hypothetical protein VF958_01840 [Thermoanaerobaculia bacterium]
MIPLSMILRTVSVIAFLGLAGPSPKPPLDFSGTWTLDEKASRGVSTNMHGAVLRVEQSGDHIRIFPVGRRAKLLGEEIVADGRPYEKALGPGRGVVTATWSKDGASLWLEVTAGTQEDPRAAAAIQRSVWKLSPDGRTWLRHSVSMQGKELREARLVFRKQERPNPNDGDLKSLRGAETRRRSRFSDGD